MNRHDAGGSAGGQGTVAERSWAILNVIVRDGRGPSSQSYSLTDGFERVSGLQVRAGVAVICTSWGGRMDSPWNGLASINSSRNAHE